MSVYQYQEGESGFEVLFGNYHGVMIPETWSMPIQSFHVPGLWGVAHLIDTTKERHLSCYLRYQGFESWQLMEQGLSNLDGYNGKLTGNVYFTGTMEGTFPSCTFLGFERTSEVKWDGSLQNGWWVEGRLHWIQRSQ